MTCLANASNGNLFLSAGFTGDVNEDWSANDATDLPFSSPVAASTKVGVLSYDLNVIQNNTGLDMVAEARCARPPQAAIPEVMARLI